MKTRSSEGSTRSTMKRGRGRPPGSTFPSPHPLARRLVHIRLSVGLTSTAAAARIGVTANTWQRWEIGLLLPSYTSLLAISTAFGPFGADCGADLGDLLRLRDPQSAELATLLTSWPRLTRVTRQRILAMVAGGQNGGPNGQRRARVGNKVGSSGLSAMPAWHRQIVASFTERQRQAVRLLSLGCSMSEAAAILGVAQHTINNDKRKVLTCLGCGTRRADLTRIAVQTGISSIDDLKRTPKTGRPDKV